MARIATAAEKAALQDMTNLLAKQTDLNTRRAFISALNAFSNHINYGTKTELKNEPVKMATTLF